MSNAYQVDTDRIRAASGKIRQVSAEVDTQVRAMMGELAALQGAWRGTAATSFQRVADDWQRTQAQVEQSLEQINQALGRAGQQYDAAEQSNAAMFG
jgi:6 kDa early secretory antigenic target